MITNQISAGMGLTAFQNANTQMAKAADQIAKASVGVPVEGRKSDLVSPITELHSASLDAKAAIKLLDVEHKTVGYLIDELA